jgi:hypothetical protein
VKRSLRVSTEIVLHLIIDLFENATLKNFFIGSDCGTVESKLVGASSREEGLCAPEDVQQASRIIAETVECSGLESYLNHITTNKFQIF